MKTITATNIRTGVVSTYRVPSRKDIVKNDYATLDSQWDPIERQSVRGSVPLVWERITP